MVKKVLTFTTFKHSLAKFLANTYNHNTPVFFFFAERALLQRTKALPDWLRVCGQINVCALSLAIELPDFFWKREKKMNLKLFIATRLCFI